MYLSSPSHSLRQCVRSQCVSPLFSISCVIPFASYCTCSCLPSCILLLSDPTLSPCNRCLLYYVHKMKPWTTRMRLRFFLPRMIPTFHIVISLVITASDYNPFTYCCICVSLPASAVLYINSKDPHTAPSTTFQHASRHITEPPIPVNRVFAPTK